MKLKFDLKDWSLSALKHGVHAVDKAYDGARYRLKRRFGWIAPVSILPYRGFGNTRYLFLHGRVLEERHIARARDDAPAWRNAVSMYKRFATDEIPNARVIALFDGQTHEAVTDSEGYFQFHLHFDDPLNAGRLWREIEVELLDRLVHGQGPVRAVGRVLTPPADSQFGVISDIDDTVLKSHATDFVQLAKLTLFHNARTRTALPGASAFYRALHGGPEGESRNPFFYVSSSAWNLYDVLCDFLAINHFPEGPVLLRDLGIDRHKFIKTGHEHKLEKVERIFAACPETPFILIGDAGQKDPQLYQQVVYDYPDRVAAVYIRNVSWLNRDEEMNEIAADLADRGVEMLLVNDTRVAAQHAAERGFLDEASLDEIAAEREESLENQGMLAEQTVSGAAGSDRLSEKSGVAGSEPKRWP